MSFKGKVTEKSMSFHGRGATTAVAPQKLRRPRTVPDLLSAARNGVVHGRNGGGCGGDEVVVARKLTKVLLNVTVQGGVGAVQVLISPESTVRDLISGVLKQYVKEGRRPVLSSFGVDEFDLHYSQFSLESLDREEKLVSLGSRNFFLCRRRVVADDVGNSSVPTSSCSKQAEKATKLGSPSPWLKFMSFLF